MARLAGGRARAPIEEPGGGDDGSGSHGQLGFEEPHVLDFRGGYDGAEDGEQCDGPAGDGAEPFAGLPGAGEDIEEREEAGYHHEALEPYLRAQRLRNLVLYTEMLEERRLLGI